MKFGLALIQVEVGFIALVIAANQAQQAERRPRCLLFLAYFFDTTGELCLSPVGLSMITKRPADGRTDDGLLVPSVLHSPTCSAAISGMTGKAAGFGPVFQGIVYSPAR